MFLSAVVLIIQEILEAVLLISILLVLNLLLHRTRPDIFQPLRGWLPIAVAAGAGGAWLYAWATPEVSLWFDFAGYEIINAVLQFVTVGLLLVLCFLLHSGHSRINQSLRNNLATMCMGSVVAIGIIREGSEIILYVTGIVGQQENVMPVLLGGIIASGIGISSGWFLFQGLASLPFPASFRAAMLILALFAANMSGQATQLLIQADWLPYSAELWNSSALLPEDSIIGRLLYALAGYEATPSLLQAAAYFLTVVLIAASPLFRLAWGGNFSDSNAARLPG
jgi:high-affinity iron transporter